MFCDIVVRDGEMVCVELVARGRGGAAQAVIFLGSIRYDTLTRVYESRVSTTILVFIHQTPGWYAHSADHIPIIEYTFPKNYFIVSRVM